jgi:hypothetical protein
MKIFKIIGVIAAVTLVLVSCKKEEPPTPQDMLEGKWIIQSQEILATVIPGDGSYLQFNACSATCSGVDYMASDTTSGTFTYTLNEAGTIISIVDNSADGGSWTAEWDVLELTETDLRITASTILGNLKVEMTKQ